MRDAVGRRPPGGALVPEVLNRRTAADAVLHVEVAAACVPRATPGVRDQRAPSIREAALEFGFQSPIVRPASGQSVVQSGAHPGHGAISIHRRGRSSIRKGVTSAVTQP